VHEGMSNRRTPNLDLGIDAGPLRFRRGVQRLIDAEYAALEQAPLVRVSPPATKTQER
jgi:hypothetical protein